MADPGNQRPILQSPTLKTLLRESVDSLSWNELGSIPGTGYFWFGVLCGLPVTLILYASLFPGPASGRFLTGVPFLRHSLPWIPPILSGGIFGVLGRTLQKRYERIRSEYNRDFLTGLYNHRYFRSRLSDRLEEARRYEHPLSLLMVDIDDFKRVNDLHGHPAGDQTLRRIAEEIRSSFRAPDIVCRYGGDEFILVLPQTELGDAQIAAERLRNRIQDQSFGNDLSLTISLGVSAYPSDANTEEDLIECVDRRLMEAKDAGRNRVIGRF